MPRLRNTLRFRIGRCLHCRKSAYIRARGLCYSCHRVEEIRGGYARMGTVQTALGEEDVYREDVPRGEPVLCLQGTEDKIMAMRERASRRQGLFHPQDGPAGGLD